MGEFDGSQVSVCGLFECVDVEVCVSASSIFRGSMIRGCRGWSAGSLLQRSTLI